MDRTFLPGLLMALLSLASMVVVLTGLQKALVRSGWEKSRWQRIFTITFIGFVAWLAVQAALSINGFFDDFSTIPPKIVLVPLTGIFISLLIAFSKWFTDLLKIIPPQWLVYFQSFRILVELLLWLACIEGLVPQQMTFEGYNFDVVSGILALPVGWALAKHKSYARGIAIVYNIVGLLLLFNIVTIAVLSMPTPFRQFTNEPANTIVANFPFIYLPGVLVVLAFAFHIFSLRQLLMKRPLHPPGADGVASDGQ